MTATAPSPASPRLSGERSLASPPGATGRRLAWAIALMLLVTLNTWPNLTGDQLGPVFPWLAIVGLPIPFVALLLGVQAVASARGSGSRIESGAGVGTSIGVGAPTDARRPRPGPEETARADAAPRSTRRRASRWLAVAGLLLLVGGLALGLIQGGSHEPPVVGVVVAAPAFLGAALLCAAPLALLPASWMPWLAAALALAGPLLSQLVRSGVPVHERFIDGSPSWLGLQAPGTLLLQLGLAGLYPALTLVVLVVAGLAIGRVIFGSDDGDGDGDSSGRLLRRPPVMRGGRRLVIGGLASIAASVVLVLVVFIAFGGVWALTALWPGASLGYVWAQLLVAGRGSAEIWSPIFLLAPAPRTGTVTDLAVSGGVSVALLGAALLLGSLLDLRLAVREPGRPIGVATLVAAIAGIGRAPLTLLFAHTLGALAVSQIASTAAMAAPQTSDFGFFSSILPWWMSSPWVWLAHVAVALAIGAACAAADRDGPVERLIDRLVGESRGVAR